MIRIVVVVMLFVAGCAQQPSADDIERMNSMERGLFQKQNPPAGVRVITEPQAEGCERVALVVDDAAKRDHALNLALHTAGALDANALLIDSVIRDQRGIDSYTLTGVAYRCG